MPDPVPPDCPPHGAGAALTGGFVGAPFHAMMAVIIRETAEMDHLTARLDALEGRLIAHRRILTQVLALSPDAVRAVLLDWLAEREVMSDGQEDPGVMADEAVALELALSDEMRLMREALVTRA